MSWMSMLYQTYENNVHMAGKYDGKQPLSPKGHVIKDADVELTIDENGELLKIIKISKEDSQTIIPVTESSDSRSGTKLPPHFISDDLSYVAGDFSNYLSSEKECKTNQDKFNDYINQLNGWVNSKFTHPKVKAIFKYVSKKCMTSDLIKADILECNGNGKLSDKKTCGKSYNKIVVRFRVNTTVTDYNSGTWQDSSLFEKYIEYYSSIQSNEQDICYLTGVVQPICVKHPKKIILSYPNAKLISTNAKINDENNFIYRGRFENAKQAMAVSYEATQKAHNALTWLAAKQGYTFGNKDKRTFICWNPKGKDVPVFDDFCGIEDDTQENSSYTEELYKKRLMDALNGYEKTLDNNDDIVVIGLDAATTGRLSVTYYNELKASDFLDRLKKWHESCCWYFTKFTADNKPYQIIMPPQTRRIAEYAFGTEQGNFIEVSDKLMKEQCQKVMNCILNAQPVPRDIIHAITIKASTPLAYSRGNHERILSTACALIKKYYEDKGAEIKMTLDYCETDRSYLFGRLLAVAEKAERATYSKEDAREPNAIRLQSAFVHHPMHTWDILEKSLNPYYQKLNPGSRKFYKDIITDIVGAICENDKALLNTSLDEKYLLGYYLQRAELNRFKKDTENNEED